MHIRFVLRLVLLTLVGCSSSHTQLDEHGKDAGKKAAHAKSHDAGIDGGADDGSTDKRDSSAPWNTRHDAGASQQDPTTDAGEPVTQPDACVSSACTDAGTSSCENHALKSNAHFATQAANALFVFDRSASMQEDWNGRPRWQVAGNAVQSALAPLADEFTAGALFFPSAASDGMCVDPTGVTCMLVPGIGSVASCAVDPITASGQIAFASGSDFVSAFAGTGGGTPPYAPVTGGNTPLVEALKEAKTALANAALTGTTAVVIITDGEPNCAWDAAMAHTIVSDWHTAGIDTYVMGLPGTDTDTATLSMLADAAGTTALEVTDSMALERTVNDVLHGAQRPRLDSCAIDLDASAAKTAVLHVIVTRDAEQYAAASADWSLASDRSSITLKGDLCRAAKNGEFSALLLVDGCVDLPPLVL